MPYLRDKSIPTLVVEHRDRLARFGVEYIEASMQCAGKTLIVVNQTEKTGDLVQDVVDEVTSMCARLYGKRSAKHRAARAIKAASEDVRPSKCTLKFATQAKLKTLTGVLDEYACIINRFIALFWDNCPAKGQLLKPLVDTPTPWLSARVRKVAAREAIDRVRAAKNRWGDKAVKPKHRGTRLCVSSTLARLKSARGTPFDSWLHLAAASS